MKVKLSILTMLSMMMFWTCTKQEVQVPNRVIVEGANELGRVDLAIKSGAGDHILNIEVEGEWEVFLPKDCDWLSAEPSSGFAETRQKVKIVLKAKKNEKFDIRKTQVSFRCDKADQKDYVIVVQDGAFFRALNFPAAKARVIGGGRTCIIPVKVNNIDEWTVSSDASWAVVSKEGTDAVKLVLEDNPEGERKAKITVEANVAGSDFNDELEFTQLAGGVQADLFDAEFKEDGGIEDISPSHRKIHNFIGTGRSVVMNEQLGVYAVQFTHGFSSTAKSAYTFQDYEMRPKLQDGFTLEAYVMCPYVVESGAEAKIFSSTSGGGMALLLKGMSFHFIYKGASWRFINSGVVPEKDRWYHIVGVYDPVNGSYVAVDGVPSERVQIGESITFSSLGANSFMTIGGNSTASAVWDNPLLNGSWPGVIARAKVYSEPLQPEQLDAALVNCYKGGIQFCD